MVNPDFFVRAYPVLFGSPCCDFAGKAFGDSTIWHSNCFEMPKRGAVMSARDKSIDFSRGWGLHVGNYICHTYDKNG